MPKCIDNDPMFLRRNNKTRAEVSLEEPCIQIAIATNWLIDILGVESDTKGIEEEVDQYFDRST